MIKADNATKRFDDITAVDHICAEAEKLAQDPTSNAVTLDGDTMVTRTSLG